MRRSCSSKIGRAQQARPAASAASLGSVEELFAEMEQFASGVGQFDDAREAIYSRAEAE